MAKAEQIIENKVRIPADVWIGRLTELLKVVEAMDSEERSAAFNFLKSKYYKEWPSGGY